jgi:GNAT superfamily N-acetyltransferase
MRVSVRALNFDSEMEQYLDLLQANLPYLPHARLFHWLYHQNPEGRALAWVVVGSDGKQIIGAAAAFPRKFYCRGKERRGYVLGDFCIAPENRALGVALALQKACLERIAEEGDFAYDFPSRSMLAVYQRMRIEMNGTMIRYSKPLRADRKIERIVPLGGVARGLSAVASATLRLFDTRYQPAGDWMVGVEEGPWGVEFTEAARRWSSREKICVARTAEYLNWRYQEHPERQFEMVTARQNGHLCGYLVRHVKEQDCVIDDLLAESGCVTEALLRETIVFAWKQRLNSLNAPWMRGHAETRILENCGFRPRESTPLVLLVLPKAKGLAEEDHEWFLTDGDRES